MHLDDNTQKFEISVSEKGDVYFQVLFRDRSGNFTIHIIIILLYTRHWPPGDISFGVRLIDEGHEEVN